MIFDKQKTNMGNPDEKLVILDFDHSLFNAEEFKESLSDIFIKYGVGKKLYEETYKEIREKEKSPYSLERHLHILEGRMMYDKKKLHKIKREVLDLMKRTDEFLFSDTMDFLRKESKRSKLVLVTLGEKEFQSLKIKSAGIKKYFVQIIISRGRARKGTKDREIAKVIGGHKDRKIFMIEDVAEEIDLLKKDYPYVTMIKIERPGGKYSKIKSKKADYKVTNLREARKIIDRSK